MRHRLPILLLGILATGCADGFDTDPAELPTVAVFSIGEADVPIPNDLLFVDSEDGTLNLPVDDELDQSDPLVAINALDGWSTCAPFSVNFDREIDGTTAILGETVHMFQVTVETTDTPVAGPVTGIVGPWSDLELGTDISGKGLELRVTRPLPQATPYMVVVTSGVLDAAGRPTARDGQYELASTPEPLAEGHPFEPVQERILAMHAAAATQGIDPDEVVVAFTFTTQSIGAGSGAAAIVALGGEQGLAQAVSAVLDTFDDGFDASQYQGAEIPLPTAGTFTDTGFSTTAFGGTGEARVFQGSVTLPYYSGISNDPSDRSAVDVPWEARFAWSNGSRNITQYNSLPQYRGTERVPVLATIPVELLGSPLDEVPVTVYVHGITSSRGAILGVADELAAAGRIGIAMDMPLHGITTEDELFGPLGVGGGQPGFLRERTFGLDLLENEDGEDEPDGLEDPSGAHFLNLEALLVGRSNLEQSVADLTALRQLLPALDLDGDGDATADLAISDVHFLGHSLGGILCTTTLALHGLVGFTPIPPVTLGMPGGGIAMLLRGSETFAEVVDEVLEDQEILPGDRLYDLFFLGAQTVVDTADPINYAARLAQAGGPIHLIEVVGGGPLGSIPDDVVPNSVVGGPLGGTEPLIREMGLVDLRAADGPLVGAGLQAVVRYTEGIHSSLSFPGATFAEIAAHNEMVRQMVEFAASGGSQLSILDSTVTQ